MIHALPNLHDHPARLVPHGCRKSEPNVPVVLFPDVHVAAADPQAPNRGEHLALAGFAGAGDVGVELQEAVRVEPDAEHFELEADV